MPNRAECLKLLKIDDHFKNSYWKARWAALDTWKETIDVMQSERPNTKIVLHHYILGDPKYETWHHVVPMYDDEHRKYHMSITNPKGKVFSEEHTRKLSESHIGVHVGRVHTEEARKNMSEAAKKRTEKYGANPTWVKARVGKEPWNKGLSYEGHEPWNKGLRSTGGKINKNNVDASGGNCA